MMNFAMPGMASNLGLGVQSYQTPVQALMGVQNMSASATGVQLQGVQGVQGVQGMQGVQGVQGAQNSQMMLGMSGVQGVQGVDRKSVV